MPAITNNEIKFIKSLSLKKEREGNGLFVVEGDKMVQEAVQSGLEVVKIYRMDEIGENAMSRITQLSAPSPSLAVVKIPNHKMPDISKGLFLALDSVRDPGNLGTIIRLCDWFGIEAIFASKDTVDSFNPKTIQSTMGAILRKKVIYCDLDSLIKDFKSIGRKVWGTFMSGDNIYTAGTLENEGLIIMGNESRGISTPISELVDYRLTIPSFASRAISNSEGSESLNVATATAIALSEFRRRK